MTRIVCIGECMVEMAPLDTVGTYRMGFAGDTLNTAWYLAKLLGDRAQIGYFTAVGTDSLSDHMLDFLGSAKIETTFILRRAEQTVGLYMIQLQDGERSFNYWRGQSAARTLAQSGKDITKALDSADIAYFSGITLAILPEQDRDTLLEQLQDFGARGGQVVFDPNLRPKLWPDTATMTSAIIKAALCSHVVLPSHEDEATWFGDATPIDTAKRYTDLGASIVVVKNGPGEIILHTERGAQHLAPTHVVNVVDTTAAGDSFNAGFLAARCTGLSPEHAVDTGAQLAARVVTHRGALVPEAINAN